MLLQRITPKRPTRLLRHVDMLPCCPYACAAALLDAYAA